MKKGLLIGFVIVVLVTAGGLYFSHRQTVPVTNLQPAQKAALVQLQADMQGIAPHFIIDSTTTDPQVLSSTDQKVKNDIVAFFLAPHPEDTDYYSGISLVAVGKRYILASQPSADSAIDEIIDSQTGAVTAIPAEIQYSLVPEGRNTLLYISNQAIYTYTLDQADAVLVPGSQLSGNETYHSGESDFGLVVHETHTKDSITIAVFDSSQAVQNPDAQPNAMQTMSKKLRDVTLSF